MKHKWKWLCRSWTEFDISSYLTVLVKQFTDAKETQPTCTSQKWSNQFPVDN